MHARTTVVNIISKAFYNLNDMHRVHRMCKYNELWISTLVRLKNVQHASSEPYFAISYLSVLNNAALIQLQTW